MMRTTLLWLVGEPAMTIFGRAMGDAARHWIIGKSDWESETFDGRCSATKPAAVGSCQLDSGQEDGFQVSLTSDQRLWAPVVERVVPGLMYTFTPTRGQGLQRCTTNHVDTPHCLGEHVEVVRVSICLITYRRSSHRGSFVQGGGVVSTPALRSDLCLN
ncbi:hypothetical protein E2C01_029658 [Portunus trituberculatus]|uniref:Uncharacterized protein n=1 Tax=Portunus trituberculatus TaxID=210409 RepID=A0A5B7ESZ9_PORTR|nr:hypothetical protein [Portunus trituberculatus]